MATNYTCRTCLRALSKPTIALDQYGVAPRRSSLRHVFKSNRMLSTTPSLYYDKAKISATPIKPKSVPRMGAGLANKIREKAPLMTETYVAYGATQELIKECSRPGTYTVPQALEKDGEIPVDDKGTHIGVGSGWWYDTLGLTPTFINWTQITFLHMYMLQVRFRMLPESHASIWVQHLTNQAFYAAEDRLVIWHKLNSNGLRQRYLKDTFAQWRAVLLSYDEGLIKGDAVLAAAVWRNLLGAKEEVDYEKLAQIVAYMRREIRRLNLASDDEILQGGWKFGAPPGPESSSRTSTVEAKV